MRFVNTFLASSELLSYLGAQDEDEYQDFDEMIAFSKAVLARAGKYFLLPGLVCELYILGKVLSTSIMQIKVAMMNTCVLRLWLLTGK